jgi:hypothetical protein
MNITLDVSEELSRRVVGLEEQLPEALALGLDELISRPREGFDGFVEVLEFLAGLPSPEDVMNLRPSVGLQAQIEQLAEKYKADSLSAQEMLLWRQYEFLEHVVRMAKARAYVKLQEQASAA